MFRFSLLSIALALPSLVNAHGYVRSVAINGQVNPGNAPGTVVSKASSIRQITDFGPVKGAMNMAINCGINAGIAAQSLQANPGDRIEFEWIGGGGGNWPHNTGPMMTYMASCGSVTCDKFDGKNAKWFKIQQVARKTDGSGHWAQQDVMDGAKTVVYIPSTLAPGNYLIRNEILALHLGMTYGGAEFYPSCTQLTIGGSGTGGPQPSELISLPGGYSDSDPGIFDKDAYDPSVPYNFPGPPVASFVNAGASKRNTYVAATGSVHKDNVVRPVRRSRVMKGLDASIIQ